MISHKAFFVPWADINEWKDVREKILSEKPDDIIRAYEIIMMWMAKCKQLPAYLECTAGLLQVMVQEHQMLERDNTLFGEYELRLAYCTALIRFVNHVHDVSEFKKDTLYRSAKFQNIPDWIVTLRHDAAHGNLIPELDTMHMAAQVSLQWLLNMYWNREESYMTDFEPSEKALVNDVADLSKLQPFFESAIKVLAICDDLETNSLHYLSDLSEEQFSHITELYKLCKHKPIFKEKVENLFQILEKCSNFQDGSYDTPILLQSLKGAVVRFLVQITRNTNSKCLFVELFAESEYMEDVNKTGEIILRFIQKLDCLNQLLAVLIRLAAAGKQNALNLLKKWAPKVESLKIQSKQNSLEDKKRKKRKENKKPLKISHATLLDLLMNALDYPVEAVHQYMSCIDPPLPDSVLKNLKELLMIYHMENHEEDDNQNDDGDDIYEGNIFTIEDLIGSNENTVSEIPVLEEDPVKSDTWIKSKIGIETWKKCPIGLLPHQSIVDCVLSNDIKWKLKSSKKRQSTPLINHMMEMKKFRHSRGISDI